MNLQKHRLAGNPAVYGGASSKPAPVVKDEPAPAPIEKDEEAKSTDTATDGNPPQVLRKDSDAVV